MDLILAPGLLDQAIEHCSNEYPTEACGLLVGRASAERLIPVKNISPDPRQFEMDPSQLIGELRNLRETGEHLLAIYHSHPHGPAEPSKTDIERAHYPEAAHLIISLAEPDRPRAEAFRIIDGAVLPIEVHVIV
jgi:[CysO sulfur-carrier protein]-S-L-cysteine hydrolase